MEYSYFLAKILGAVITIFALASFVRPLVIRDAVRDFDHESFARLVVGCLAIGAGVAIILSHSVWEWSWRGLITVFGWTVFIKGGFYLFAPKDIHRLSKAMLGSNGSLRVFTAACFILGIYLLYKGFGN